MEIKSLEFNQFALSSPEFQALQRVWILPIQTLLTLKKKFVDK